MFETMREPMLRASMALLAMPLLLSVGCGVLPSEDPTPTTAAINFQATAAAVELVNLTAVAEAQPTQTPNAVTVPSTATATPDATPSAEAVSEQTTVTPDFSTNQATPTARLQIPEPTATSVAPTSTPTQPPAETPTQVPSPTPTPTQVVIPPTAIEPSSLIQFNQPFPLSLMSNDVLNGPELRLIPEDFTGAYRRDDGVLYDRPALHIYGRGSDADVATAEFVISQAPTSYLVIAMTGMDDERDEHVPMRLKLNGNIVWEGTTPFGNEEWTDIGWLVAVPSWLRSGWNELTIENLEANGEIGAVPWILLTTVSVYYQ